MMHLRMRHALAALALGALAEAGAAGAFETLNDENLSGAVISQPDDAAFGPEAETAGEEKPGREPGADADLIRASRVVPPPQFQQDHIDLTVQRG